MKVKLKDLGVISTGNTPSKNIPEFYNSKDIGFVKPDVISDSQIDSVEITQEYLSEVARRKARIVKKDAIFVTCIGTIGKVGIVKAKELAFNQQINAITPNSDIVSKYLAYCIFANRKKLQAVANAPVVPIINKTQFGDFEVDITSNITRQELIVKTLDLVNNIITLRKQQLQQLDDLVKARFVEMFGDPVKNDKGWKYKALNDVCDGIGDGLHGTPIYDDNGDYPFINGNNLIDGKIVVTPATKMVSEETYNKHLINISRNAILISINGTLGKLSFYNGEQVMLGKSACYCNLKKDVNKVFVYGVMKSESFAEFLDNSSTKSTIKNVGLKAMREFKLILPPVELQEQFATFVEQVDKSKVAVQKALDEAQTLFDSLMQEYFG